MQNKTIWIVVMMVLIIALAGIYITLSGSKKLTTGLNELAAGVSLEVQKLNLKTAPYVYIGEAVGYVIEFENGAKFYLAGDTGLTADFQVIGDYYKPDVAIVPIGNFYSCDIKCAAYAAKLIDPAKYIIPGHYASFPMFPKDPSGFFTEVAEYNLRAQSLTFVAGVEQNVMGIKTMWLGHGAWFFESPKGVKILVDPEVTYNGGYPAEWKDLALFKKIDLILITHGHFDHMTTPDLEKWADLYHPVVIAPFEAGIWLKQYLNTPIMPLNKGARITKEEMKLIGVPEDKANNIEDIVISITPASHSTGATPPGLAPQY